MGELSQQTDHTTAGLARFAAQFKGKSRLQAFVSVFLKQIQDIEDAAWGVYVGRWLANAVGVQLDTLGKLVGQSRGNSLDDAEYRMRITARILCNRSSGTTPNIYAVFQALLPGVSLQLLPDFPAGFEFYINTVITAPYALLYASFMSAAKLAGVAANVVYYLTGDPTSFFIETTWTYLTTGIPPGTTTLPVASTTGWPSSGSLTLDKGTSVEETVAFSAISPTLITCAATTNPHNIQCGVALVGTQGQGFAVQGAYLASAQLAGVSSLPLTSLYGPPGGVTFPVTAVIDEALPTQETLTITGVSGGAATLTTPTQFAHEQHAPIVMNLAKPGGMLAGVIAA